MFALTLGRMAKPLLVIAMFCFGVWLGSTYTHSAMLELLYPQAYAAAGQPGSAKVDYQKAGPVTTKLDDNGQHVIMTPEATVTILEPFAVVVNPATGVSARRVSTMTEYKTPVAVPGKPSVTKKVMLVIFDCQLKTEFFVAKMMLMSATDELVAQELHVNKVTPMEPGSAFVEAHAIACSRGTGTQV